jgi:hypothetical protein
VTEAAELVLARMRRNPSPLYLRELQQGTGLAAEVVQEAVNELYGMGLIVPGSWRAVDAGPDVGMGAGRRAGPGSFAEATPSKPHPSERQPDAVEAGEPAQAPVHDSAAGGAGKAEGAPTRSIGASSNAAASSPASSAPEGAADVVSIERAPSRARPRRVAVRRPRPLQ